MKLLRSGDVNEQVSSRKELQANGFSQWREPWFHWSWFIDVVLEMECSLGKNVLAIER
jgi:hypothetical protein